MTEEVNGHNFNSLTYPEGQIHCKRCGQSFACRPDAISSCQCAGVALSKETLQFLKKTSWGCLCAACLQQVNQHLVNIQGQAFPKPNELKEGTHYYKENGLWVFTETYHMLRGSCCRSGCRHCPYGFKK